MIRAILARNGGGKGVTMGHVAVLPSWRAGRPVVANYTLYPERCGFPGHLFKPLTSWTQITRLGVQCWQCRRFGMLMKGATAKNPGVEMAAREHAAALGKAPCPQAELSVTDNRPCTLLLDEITSVLPSRGSADMPVELQRMLHQFRKPDIWFCWAAVAWARCDLIAREATVDVVEVSPVLPRITAKRVPGEAWAQQRVFRMELFDAWDYNEHDEGGRLAALQPKTTKYLWRRKARELAMATYDTKEGVALLDNVQCGDCGGRLPRQACKCSGKDRRTGTKSAAIGAHI